MCERRIGVGNAPACGPMRADVHGCVVPHARVPVDAGRLASETGRRVRKHAFAKVHSVQSAKPRKNESNFPRPHLRTSDLLFIANWNSSIHAVVDSSSLFNVFFIK